MISACVVGCSRGVHDVRAATHQSAGGDTQGAPAAMGDESRAAAAQGDHPLRDARQPDTTRALPELSFRHLGMHIGGEPNTEAAKRPWLADIDSQREAILRCYRAVDAPGASGSFGFDLYIGRDGGTAEIRDSEAAAAAKILGVAIRENLNMRDGFFVNDEEHQLAIIRMIRKYKPEIVLCNAIDDRHIDHGKGSKLVSDACFLSGLIKIETQYNGASQPAHRPKVVYHYIQWKNIEPDFVVDVSGFLEKKLEAVFAFGSQFYQNNPSEPETPITSTNFRDSITYRAQDLGRLIGVEHAEGFTVERPLAVGSLYDLI